MINPSHQALKTFAVGLGVTLLVTLGAALASVGPTTDVETWARNLLIAEASAIGVYIVNRLRPAG
ncbi:MAG TPA: hypothetical protein VI759_10065 [Dehalococcoidia bacterium]|nr:hypothetical protein [Dehalococcoidia bacterium]